MGSERQYAAKAFVSCSLRKEDKPFVDFICRILHAHNIEPSGTVGKFSSSPENPVDLMKRNIPLSDMVVICATPRYYQEDVKSGEVSLGLSEMVHVETGIALANEKPVVVFVQEGTDVGSVLPNVTQYIILNGEEQDYIEKQKLILSLLSSAFGYVQKVKENKNISVAGGLIIGGLAIYGGVKLFQYLFSDNK